MERQPRVSVAVEISVQVRAPMKSCQLAPSAIRLWYPSVITIPELVTVKDDRSRMVSSPQVCAAVPAGQGCGGTGVPATYMVEPFTRATLAAGKSRVPTHWGFPP